jgi:hypothetical protein
MANQKEKPEFKKKTTETRRNEWTDSELVNLGVRQPLRVIEPNRFKKSDAEKAALDTAKRKEGKIITSGMQIISSHSELRKVLAEKMRRWSVKENKRNKFVKP